MAKAARKVYVAGRRNTDATKLNFSTNSVAQIVIWVLSLAAAWYGVQSQLSEIQASIKVMSTQMIGDAKLSERDAKDRDSRVRELEVNMKAYDIRIRQLENENARRGGK